MEQLSKQSLLITYRRNQSLMLGIVILVVSCFLIFQFLIPNITRVQEVIATSKQEEQKLDSLRRKVTILDSTDKTKELTTLKKIVSVLPEEKDVFTIFSGIDSLEQDTGVVITESEFRIGVVSTESAVQAVDSRENKLSVDIQFEAVGDEEAIRKLFDLLGTVKTRLFTANDVSIEYISAQEIIVRFKLTAYFLPFPAKLGNVDSPLPALSEKEQSLKEMIEKESLPVSEEVPQVPSGKTNLFGP